MNKYIFSPSENMFYPVELKSLYSEWPVDATEVPDSAFNEYTGALPEGKMRGVDDAGLPCWVDIPGGGKTTPPVVLAS
ncbi:hypothetical protein AACI93_001789 [Escherichia coli]|nr:hypothetical protein [Escherichia coli]